LFHTGKLTLLQFVSLFTTNPARILSLAGGTLAPGSPADLTVFSLDTDWVYDVNKSSSKSRNSPFHGRKLKGGPFATIVGGKLVWRAGEFS
jgi:dihydroorotase